MLDIVTSHIRKHPSLIWTILCHTPTLDPLIILRNDIVLYIVSNDGSVDSFVAIKKYSKVYELGTVYTYPDHRHKGYASILIRHAVDKYRPIGLLCKQEMVDFYTKYGFVVGDHGGIIFGRKWLFNTFLKPILGYLIVMMVYSKNPKR